MIYRHDLMRDTVIAAVVFAGWVSTPVAAQDTASTAATEAPGGLDEIVVTAQRRAENLQEVPIAIAAVTAEALERSGIRSTDAITQAVPAVQFGRSGASGLFFVRGVGTTNASTGDEGSNAFYVDGVYLPDLGQTVTNFNNIERIEVLKGPQGTLFGRNAFGGLLQIITREPGDTWTTSGEVSYGNYQTAQGRLYAGGPINDRISVDIALTGQDQGKGWGRNVTLDKEIKKLDYWGARSKLVFRPNDDVKITLAGDYYGYNDDTALAWSLNSDFVGLGGTRSVGTMDTNANDPALSRLRTWGASLTVEGDLGFASVTSISSIRDNENRSYFDPDGGPIAWSRIAFTSGSRAYQQEVRLASKTAGPLTWQLGGFFLRSEVTNDFRLDGLAFGGPRTGSVVNGELDTNSIAGFGEVTYAVTPRTKVTGGLRWTKDTRRLDAERRPIVADVVGGVSFATDDRISYDELTYRLAVRQELNDDISVYGSINRGFKAGTFAIQDPERAPVRPQFIMAYEIGLKSELFDRRLRLNLSAYHYDISDYQVRSAALGPGTAVLLNAADVKVDGFDAEFEAAPVEAWRLFGGFTILNSRYSNFGPIPSESQGAPFVYPNPAVCDAGGTADPGTTTGTPTGGFKTCFGDATGNKTPYAPDFSASLGSSYSLSVGNEGEVRLSALLSYNSGFAFEADNLLRQNAFAVLNGSIEYRPNTHWGVELWGANITDTKYFTQKISTAFGSTTARAAPATYGLRVKFDY